MFMRMLHDGRQWLAGGAMRLAFCCLLALLITAGCSPPSTTGTPTATGTPENVYKNPVLRSDFPDPGVLHVGDTYYAYATNAAGKNVQVARSNDLVNWDILNDAMPALPSWAQPGGSYVWAPEVIQVGNTYVMYYTARDMQSNKQCVGVATSERPEGKFKDRSDHPLVCQADQGGTIDPFPFRDGDKLYLYFKNDGNCCGLSTHLYVQPLAPDGLTLHGQPVSLGQNDALWEGKVVEAPTMFKHDDAYYLFYSANDYAGVNYAVGYARCSKATGPCKDASENPILASQMKRDPNVIGPGGQSLVQVGKQTWIVYHAWDVTADGQQGDNRYMYIDRINWQDGKPRIQGPTTSPQPMP
jgi:beta-xylosidase